MTTPALALLAGVLTVGAPCVLPMLPVVLGASVAGQHPLRPVAIALGFVTAFAALGLLFASFTHVLGLSPDGLRTTAAAMLMAFGLLMVWPAPAHWLAMHTGRPLARVAALGTGAGKGLAGGLLVGLSLGALWTPCAGPVLGSILTLVATEPIGTNTALLLASYALGAGVPLLAIGYGGQLVASRLHVLARHGQRVQQVFGVVIVLVAAAMFLQLDASLSAWLTQALPSLSTGL
jgi:cytochrome c-type biogenesis protein